MAFFPDFLKFAITAIVRKKSAVVQLFKTITIKLISKPSSTSIRFEGFSVAADELEMSRIGDSLLFDSIISISFDPSTEVSATTDSIEENGAIGNWKQTNSISIEHVYFLKGKRKSAFLTFLGRPRPLFVTFLGRPCLFFAAFMDCSRILLGRPLCRPLFGTLFRFSLSIFVAFLGRPRPLFCAFSSIIDPANVRSSSAATLIIDCLNSYKNFVLLVA